MKNHKSSLIIIYGKPIFFFQHLTTNSTIFRQKLRQFPGLEPGEFADCSGGRAGHGLRLNHLLLPDLFGNFGDRIVDLRIFFCQILVYLGERTCCFPEMLVDLMFFHQDFGGSRKLHPSCDVWMVNICKTTFSAGLGNSIFCHFQVSQRVNEHGFDGKS